ncbi:MAG: hypothetical protein HY063_12730 [Bacteroidetes bacterium]|nr:hypothetical protein [Bacteroidota bacterium]
MKQKFLPPLFLFSCFLLFVTLSVVEVSCRKAGPGGKAVIKGTVTHSTKPVPGTVVYIKYNTQSFPGANINNYDASTVADASAIYEFDNLRRGDYYLFGVGFDSTAVKTVSGGTGTSISSKDETIQVDLQVNP